MFWPHRTLRVLELFHLWCEPTNIPCFGLFPPHSHPSHFIFTAYVPGELQASLFSGFWSSRGIGVGGKDWENEILVLSFPTSVMPHSGLLGPQNLPPDLVLPTLPLFWKMFPLLDRNGFLLWVVWGATVSCVASSLFLPSNDCWPCLL